MRFIPGVLDVAQEHLTWEDLLGTLSQENHQVLRHFVQQDCETQRTFKLSLLSEWSLLFDN